MMRIYVDALRLADARLSVFLGKRTRLRFQRWSGGADLAISNCFE